MRVAQVSAHFPPNFVSGGTLVPQRIARAVAAAGHESYVYAGYLDAEKQPLKAWSDRDDEVVIRWIVTTPWTSWADPRNSNNPEVDTDFRQWLAEVRPEVVHFHSLQTLGGSLVRAAKDSGAKIIVTMHDFWWFCARQFLVDVNLRPCALVVSCGSCQCQVDNEWLFARNVDLAHQFAAADIILAPSASAARVLGANGVPAEKLRVDENGLLGSEASCEQSVGAKHEGPIRFMYAGGHDPLKGADVIQATAGRLADLAGWTLDMYGMANTTTAELPSQVSVQPPYPPGKLHEVLAAHDVLVLPSIMRESHSILTREALSAGLAVVCSDTLGPEEAVEHGRNGLVVPAGDVDALSASLRGLIEEPAVARRMLAKGSASPVRLLADQTEGLVALYSELLAPEFVEPESDDAPVMRVAAQLMQRVIFVIGIQGAPLRYRAHLPAEALRMLGVSVEVRHYRDPELTALVREADAVVFYRVPATHQVQQLIAGVRARDRRIPVLFDVDDLIFDPELENQVHGLAALSDEERSLWWRGVARYRTTMEAADMFIGSTDELCRHASSVTGLPSRRFENGVGTLLGQASDEALMLERTPGPLRIGYFSGTTTHDADWASVEPAVIAVMAKRPDVELWLGGHLRTTPSLDRYADRVKRLPFAPWHELPKLLRDVDVCLAPLTEDSLFNEAKSAIKWLEAALVETPVVASPTQPFREAIDHGRTGYLAGTSEEWAEAISTLLDDVAARRRVGTQARREALLRWSPHLQGPVYLENLIAAAEHVRSEGARQPTNWVPVVDDEPFSKAEAYVEPYQRPTGRQLLPATVRYHRVVRKAAAARRVYRSEGLSALLRKAVVVARRRIGR
ncbi:glycosyltransferase [Rhodococcus opacus]|uniref:glycosyltransferase n=1 Tax=Rhodococcus opacus TaxID=37919 RepID=UPI0024BA2AFA|nr:glycosyltransferase [Rhodococcus opacus]MDJ0416384.1 glycosyltransferase [Rhodococcus opacus]